jgi:hypothetical protein
MDKNQPLLSIRLYNDLNKKKLIFQITNIYFSVIMIF